MDDLGSQLLVGVALLFLGWASSWILPAKAIKVWVRNPELKNIAGVSASGSEIKFVRLAYAVLPYRKFMKNEHLMEYREQDVDFVKLAIFNAGLNRADNIMISVKKEPHQIKTEPNRPVSFEGVGDGFVIKLGNIMPDKHILVELFLSDGTGLHVVSNDGEAKEVYFNEVEFARKYLKQA